LLRVPRGTVRPTRAYVIGDNVPHTIKRVDRLDAETLLVLVDTRASSRRISPAPPHRTPARA
jgi:hypothetical protein